MASATIRANDRFPVGTSLAVYPAQNRIDGHSPSGSAVTSATVASDSTVTFASLADGAYYVAYASVGGEHRYIGFATNPLPAESDAVSLSATAPQTIVSRLNVNAPTGIALNLDGNLDGGAANPYRIGLGIGTANGSNGTRGDSIAVDTANGTGASFFAPYYVNATSWADRGSLTHFTSYLTVSEVGAGGVYGEGFSFYGGVTTDRKGALTGGLEVQNTVNSGKPARASAANLIVKENNAPPTYTGFARTAENGYTTADFGAGSQWLKGARVLDLISSGSQSVGVGVNFRGAFTRPILFEPDASNGFAVGSSGWVDVLRSGGASSVFRAFRADVSTQQESVRITADGKYGAGPGGAAIDVTWERAQAGVWKVTNAIQLVAIAAASVPNNTIFLDSADNVIKRKDNAGAVAAI